MTQANRLVFLALSLALLVGCQTGKYSREELELAVHRARHLDNIAHDVDTRAAEAEEKLDGYRALVHGVDWQRFDAGVMATIGDVAKVNNGMVPAASAAKIVRHSWGDYARIDATHRAEAENDRQIVNDLRQTGPALTAYNDAVNYEGGVNARLAQEENARAQSFAVNTGAKVASAAAQAKARRNANNRVPNPPAPEHEGEQPVAPAPPSGGNTDGPPIVFTPAPEG